MDEKKQTFCELMKAQLADEEHAGELYETARKLLQENEDSPNKAEILRTQGFRDQGPVAHSFADAILEKIATDERSHKVLLKVLTERLCP